MQQSANQEVSTVLTQNERQRYSLLLDVVRRSNKLMTETVQALREIRDEQLYRAGYRTFDAFLDAEFPTLSRSEVSRLIRINELNGDIKLLVITNKQAEGKTEAEAQAEAEKFLASNLAVGREMLRVTAANEGDGRKLSDADKRKAKAEAVLHAVTPAIAKKAAPLTAAEVRSIVDGQTKVEEPVVTKPLTDKLRDDILESVSRAVKRLSDGRLVIYLHGIIDKALDCYQRADGDGTEANLALGELLLNGRVSDGAKPLSSSDVDLVAGLEPSAESDLPDASEHITLGLLAKAVVELDESVEMGVAA